MVESMDLLKQTSPTNWSHRLDYSWYERNAVNIIYSKIPSLIAMGINAKVGIWLKVKQMTNWNQRGLYNNDLEDVF
jgi:hypothetical protein